MERRKNERIEKWIPVRLDGTSKALAVTHNASRHGIMMVTACKLEVGSSVRLTLELGPKHPDGINIQGRIVRFEENRKDPRGLWPYSAAVQFDAPVPELEEQLKNKAS